MTKLASEPGPLKAYELVMAFATRRGEAALRLAMHAALPQVLRPELLHLIRLNYLPESSFDLAIEADVLFASFCEDIGNGYYCFSANARLQLLQGLDPSYPDESMPRSMQVARFMLDYLDHGERDVRIGSDRLRSDWIEVERWSALAFAEPALAASQLAAALARATANDDVAARVRVGGLASALATPLARFSELLTYAEGVEALQMGRTNDADRLFSTMPDREIEIAGVRLKSPRRVFAESMRKEATGVLETEPAKQPGATEEDSGQYTTIVGNSPAIRSVVEMAKKAAQSTVSVLLLGETGTGKELFARSIHRWSPRAAMPFIAINCAALPEELLENELFGHEQGAFTGADQQKKGKLEIADGGTVFLDEIGDVSLSVQAKLLRVLQDRESHRMGGSMPVLVNIRIIAATKKDLKQAVRAGQFREDLYFRLNVISLTLPPLRERSEDIPALAQFFLGRHARDANRPGMTLSAAALETLTRYPWPGNIRELENVIKREVILSQGNTIELEVLHLPNLTETEEQSIEQATPARNQIYIFINSRREDNADFTGRICDRLDRQFGREIVFRDTSSIPLGVDFRAYLDEQLAKCDVFLAVIGRDWMNIEGRKGKSRLEDPDDFVRIEIESAFKRRIPVIPVLVGGASLPPADRLPAGIRELSYRNGMAVRPDPDFHRDMDHLIEYFRREFLDESGFTGVDGTIVTKADAILSRLPEEVRGTFDRVFVELVYLKRDRPPTRRRAPLSHFTSEQAAMQLIEALAGQDCPVLITSGTGEEALVEVAHEKLFSAWPKLKSWIDKNGEALRDINHAEEEAMRWQKEGDNPQELWLGSRAKKVFVAIEQFGKRLSPELRRFLRPQEVLIAQLNEHALTHQERLLIGQKLAEFGDQWPGVGVKDGLPDIAWIEIPGGKVKLEEVDPVFTVKPFRMAKYPVTNAQFDAFLMAQDGYRNEAWWKDIERQEAAQPSWREVNCPRETVSWYDAIAFCRWLSARTGTNIRLPTEWEWQLAATGGNLQREYPWEGGWDSSRCNSYGSRLNRTTAVGIYPTASTEQGVHDMAGNVWEWCLNEHDKPERPEAMHISNRDGQRVIRGGSWNDRPEALRASTRNWNTTFNRHANLGFRLVQDIP